MSQPSPHVTSEAAARWVAGVLDADAAAALEGHVSSCPQCEALLQAEARAEEALAVASRSVPLAPARRVGWAVVVPLALAASLLALLWRGSESRGALTTDAGPALARGLAVPRYEGEAAPPVESATARRPFEL